MAQSCDQGPVLDILLGGGGCNPFFKTSPSGVIQLLRLMVQYAKGALITPIWQAQTLPYFYAQGYHGSFYYYNSFVHKKATQFIIQTINVWREKTWARPFGSREYTGVSGIYLGLGEYTRDVLHLPMI